MMRIQNVQNIVGKKNMKQLVIQGHNYRHNRHHTSPLCGLIILISLFLANPSFSLSLSYPTISAPPQNTFSFRLNNSFIKSPSFDALSTNDSLLLADFTYAHQFLRLGRGSLWAEATYGIGAKSSELFGQTIQTDLLIQSVTVGVSYQFPIKRWFIPHLRLGLGTLVGSLDVELSGEGKAFDRAAAFTSYLLAGWEYTWQRKFIRPGTFLKGGGLIVEGGYAFNSSLHFDMQPESDDDERSIPALANDLGSLQLSGAQLRIGALMYF